MEEVLSLPNAVVGVLVLLILREVFAFLRAKRNGDPDWRELSRQVADLWEWHNQTDPTTGAKIWYVHRGLEDAVTKLADNIGTQTEILQSFSADLRETSRGVDRLERKTNGLKPT